MQKIYFILFMILNVPFMQAQNLVLNPGFDSYITCPGFGQFSNIYINDWNKPTIASSDYYHYNCPGIQPSVQVPQSGEGYAGLIAYNFGTEYREYITGTLSAPLTAGQLYNVEFYVSLNNGYIQAVNELGAYFSQTPPGPFPNSLHINVVPQVENISAPLNDTINWRLITGQFIAAGGEQYITIGNFRDDMNTTITQPGTSGSFGAYYFIEDVSVIPDSATSINNLDELPKLKVWFHDEELHIQALNIALSNFPLQLITYNALGQKVLDLELNEPSATISLTNLSENMYFFTISKNGETLAGVKAVMHR